MDYFCYFLVCLASLFSSFTGTRLIRKIRAVKGESCVLPCSKDAKLELSDVAWSRSDLDLLLVVFRGWKVLEGYEDPFYRNRVEFLDPQLQTELSVVLKNVTEKDSGEYRCEAVYEDGQEIKEISQLILLNVIERETTKTEAHTRIKTETNTKPSLGLILVLVFGLFALILVIVLGVLFRKLIKHKLFDSRESSCFEKSKEPSISRTSSSSSSDSSTLSDGSDTPLVKKTNPLSPPSGNTEQFVLTAPGTPSLEGRKHVSALPL